VLVPTGTNLLGLVKHLAAAERYWFGLYLTGITPPEGSKLSGQRLTLRWLLAHMTSETARHAGHADIPREQIDGVTGR
jgi:hypothetical protein